LFAILTNPISSKQNHTFKAIPQEEEEEGGGGGGGIDHGHDLPDLSLHTKKRSLQYYLINLALISSVFFTGDYLIIANRAHQTLWSSCGSSSNSACERNCSFDLISISWQTPECYDAPLASEFVARNAWNFYTEAHGNVTVPFSHALKGEQNLWVDWNYHITHCLFMWRQMPRAYERGWIDAHLRSYNHTLHCQKKILEEGVEPDAVNTTVNVIYPVYDRVVATPNERDSWDSRVLVYVTNNRVAKGVSLSCLQK
jgi:hypothetical protein